MLASVALDPVHFAPLARQWMSPAEIAPVDCIDPERQALIDEIRRIEGAPVPHAPLLFRFVELCGVAMCVSAGGGLCLGAANLLAVML